MTTPAGSTRAGSWTLSTEELKNRLEWMFEHTATETADSSS
ncbi:MULTISPECIES: hypothetical protein [Rhodococcus]|uniref:Uncharacterized protein n=1 Tax=Rhodococcus oxybenzonivorans TaxID=1990687 RepID=A0AAE4V308_9NOCA|nr:MULTISPECIES: hypothetical protein [Rhodococcus]MDV7242366.1 hypothetical protein [Rhodococcus oxybenzonivorans]MDV7267673.1 hypothetical protein [Rhodococcus oxybenzonivorans]MDV7277113.1 hypothetical protein [Rhodococcus oxybenzonivorans]MDV7331855.1 hypothetical protein [Rhodococcus oxybenzonivorans]MDV7344076.1 hypothetical protein [Rhodococcus oxybenzonivorans]